MWIDHKFVVIEKILKHEKGSLLDLGSRDQILKKFLPEKIGYTGVVKVGKKAYQLIIGAESEIIANEMKRLVDSGYGKKQEKEENNTKSNKK